MLRALQDPKKPTQERTPGNGEQEGLPICKALPTQEKPLKTISKLTKNTAKQSVKATKSTDKNQLADPNIKTEIDLMTISEKGISQIKSHEGIKIENGIAVMYDKDGSKSGNATVGYGHKIHDGPISGHASEKPFEKGISLKQSEELLKKDIQTFEHAIKKHLTRVPTQGQLDAMVSLAYNIGPGQPGDPKKRGFCNSEVLQRFNSGDMEGAAKAFLNHSKDTSGNKLPGLVKRREEEVILFKS